MGESSLNSDNFNWFEWIGEIIFQKQSAIKINLSLKAQLLNL